MTSPAAWVSAASALLAVVLVGRWAVRRRDSLGRRRPFPAVGAVLCAVLAVATGYPAVRLARLDTRLSAAASQVAGVPVDVRCKTFTSSMLDADGNAGHVAHGSDRAVIDRDRCTLLRAWLDRRGAGATIEEITAVHILTHEAMHVAGEFDEAKAECRAVQRDAELARRLGAAPEDALAVARRYYREVLPRMPDGYRPGGCLRGGPLDEGRPDPPW